MRPAISYNLPCIPGARTPFDVLEIETANANKYRTGDEAGVIMDTAAGIALQ